jgi:hypothetical protein
MLRFRPHRSPMTPVWHCDWHSEKEDPASAFRCGSLTQSGRLALAPMQ